MTLAEIQALDEQYYLPVFGARTPVAFTQGKGSLLYDTEGQEYVDFLGGIAVTALGHSHPKVTEAITEQAGKLLHTSSLYYIEQQELLAQQLVEHSVLDRAFFCNSGAEANEAALKAARRYFYAQGQDQYQVITANASFHGRTLATVAATGQPKYQKPYQPLTPGFVHVPYNDLEAMEQAIGPYTGAILLETIQGEGGVIEADADYLRAVQKLCKRKRLLLILDEVQTGMGRTGKLFSYEHFDLFPDIVTLAKALGNGVPIGAMLCTQRVADSLQPGDHGSTFGGNPLACAAALAVVDTMLTTGILRQCAETGLYFKDKLEALANKHPEKIRMARGRGLLLGLALANTVDGRAVAAHCFEKKLIINCAGDNTLRFAPPFCIEKTQIDALLLVLDQYFAKAAEEAKHEYS